MAECLYLHLRTNQTKKEKMRRSKLKIFLRPWHKICLKRPQIPFSFIGFLGKELGW